MSNQKKAITTKLTPEQLKALNACTSVASMVRFMNTITTDRGEISRFLSAHLEREVRYQWVRNVLITPLKKA
jgi:nuclear transport factor 2 (NTF2) superfamily protein